MLNLFPIDFTFFPYIFSYMFFSDYNLFINCGGQKVTIDKNEYEEDTDPSGRSSYKVFGDRWAYSSTGIFKENENEYYIASSTTPLNMSNPELYVNARLSPLSLKYYGLCLQNGIYTVNLHFAEIMFTDDQTYSAVGRRLFDVSIQVVTLNFYGFSAH